MSLTDRARRILPKRRTPVTVGGMKSRHYMKDGEARRFRVGEAADRLVDYEYEHVTGLRAFVQPGDRVVIVGGGIGITACWAGTLAGPNGEVIVYESRGENAAAVRETIQLNGIQNATVRVEHVGSDTTLPECDVLELDCEGCEYEVLAQIDIEPRVVLIEHHVGMES